MLERIIKASSNEGDLILDPFSGTFTTAFVAKTLNRRAIGIELQEDYVKIGLRRLELASEYNGEAIQRELKTYQRQAIDGDKQTTLNFM